MGGADITDAVAERRSENPEAEAVKHEWADADAEMPGRRRTGSSRRPGRRSSTRCAGSLDYYPRHPGRVRSTGSCCRAADRGLPASPSACPNSTRIEVERGTAFGEPRDRQHRPQPRTDRIRRAPGRRAGRPRPGRLPHDHLDPDPPGRDATGQPAPAGDRGGRTPEADQGAARVRDARRPGNRRARLPLRQQPGRRRRGGPVDRTGAGRRSAEPGERVRRGARGPRCGGCRPGQPHHRDDPRDPLVVLPERPQPLDPQDHPPEHDDSSQRRRRRASWIQRPRRSPPP